MKKYTRRSNSNKRFVIKNWKNSQYQKRTSNEEESKSRESYKARSVDSKHFKKRHRKHLHMAMDEARKVEKVASTTDLTRIQKEPMISKYIKDNNIDQIDSLVSYSPFNFGINSKILRFCLENFSKKYFGFLFFSFHCVLPFSGGVLCCHFAL